MKRRDKIATAILVVAAIVGLVFAVKVINSTFKTNQVPTPPTTTQPPPTTTQPPRSREN